MGVAAVLVATATAGVGRWGVEEYQGEGFDFEAMVWPFQGAATSKMTNTKSVREALGRPDVWPKYDVSDRVWIPKSTGSDKDYMELVFDPPVWAKQVHVFETSWPGCVTQIVDISGKGEEVLYKARVSKESRDAVGRKAKVLYVDIEPVRRIAKLRVVVSPKKAGYTRPAIDAVGLVKGEPPPGAEDGEEEAELELESESQSDELVITTRRYNQDEYEADYDDFDELVWVSRGLGSSSNMADKYSPSTLEGQPDGWPYHAMAARPKYNGVAWAPRDSDSKKDWVEVEFPETECREIHIFEVYAPESIWKVVDLSGDEPRDLFSQKPVKDAHKKYNQKAQVFSVRFSKPQTISKLKLVVSPLKAGYVKPGFDAIGLVK